MCVLKVLHGSEWRRVLFTPACDQVKARSHCIDHFLQTVTFDIQSAAFLRTVFGERGKDEVASRL